MSADAVQAVIGGATFPNWTSYQVESDVLTPGDAFSLELAMATPAQIAAVSEGAAITLLVGADTILTGWVDEKRVATSRSGTTLAITGRDATAPLLDCSVPLSWTRRRISLEQLVRAAVAELGITVTVFAHADAAESIAYVKPEPGESFWELLEREARRLRLMLWSDPAGLHVDRPDYTTASVGALTHRITGDRSRNNLMRIEAVWRTAGRRTPVTVVGQSPGSDDLSGASAQRVVGTATDAELAAMGLTRPLVVIDAAATTSERARARAEWEVSKRKGEALVLVGDVWGHRPNADSVWTPNTMVDVNDESLGIAAPFWVAARRFTRSRDQGTRTTLTLRTSGAILPPVAG